MLDSATLDDAASVWPKGKLSWKLLKLIFMFIITQ